jgi:lysophospholipase L1-like esterase
MVPALHSRHLLIPAASAGLFFAACAQAFAANGVVVGDSLGVGISMAGGLENHAKNSVTIRGTRAIEQLREVRPGSTVFMSLGTNDAVGPVKGIEKSIDHVVQAANAARVKLIWLGPPCVNKAWDKNAAELDGILRERLAGSGVVYVSMRDQNICAPSVRSKDGVHFNMQGYRAMWAKAANAAGYQVASASPVVPALALQEELPAKAMPQPSVQNVAVPREIPTETPRETPRVRTTVTAATLAPISSPQFVLSQFVPDFRWKESSRFTGRFVPAD